MEQKFVLHNLSLYNDSRTKYFRTLSTHLGTLGTVTSRDLEVDVVSSEIQRFAQKHEEKLHHNLKVSHPRCVV